MRCLINYFSIGREKYKFGTERLITTTNIVGMDIDIIIHSPEFNESQIVNFRKNNKLHMIKGMPVTQKYGQCGTHQEHPYQFKAFCIQHALEQGYDQILWCDSSIMIFRNPEHYFKLAHEIGVILFDNPGCLEGVWTSDDCLARMGCSPEYANTFFQCDAGIMLFDFTHFKTELIFNEYIEYCLDGVCLKGASGSNRPEFKAHRHDQSIISYIAKKHGITFLSYGTWTYASDEKFLTKKFRPTFAKVGITGPDVGPFKENFNL